MRHANVKFLPNGAMEASETYIDCGEGGDLASLRLPKVQEQLLDALRVMGKPIVSLFVIGRAYTPIRKYCDIDRSQNPYAFGYGLSYTTFAYSDMTVVQKKNEVCVSGCVKNTGPCDGKETVQLYVHKMGGTVTHRAWELLRFEKVKLKIGDSYKYQFVIPFDELQDVINGELPEQLKIKVGDCLEMITVEER